jgi:hypothetical protein
LVAFPASTSFNTTNWYYRADTIPGYVYKNFTASSFGPAILLTTASADTDYTVPCFSYGAGE